MSLNSINTNVGASIALAALNMTNASLDHTQKEISTGYRVSDATDDGAAFAIAQRVRSDVGALTSANQQLGSIQGLVQTSITALTDVQNTMNSARDVLVKLADSSLSSIQHSQYATQYSSLMSNIYSFLEDAKYNTKSLIGNVGANTSGYGEVAVVRNELGATYGIGTFGGSELYGSIAVSAGLTTLTTALAAITATGVFTRMLDSVGTALNNFGSNINYLNNQVSYNNNKIDSLNNGLGSLIDADLAKESASLQALQIRQQLGTQALSIANQAPQALLSLFK
jgi:flagellin